MFCVNPPSLCDAMTLQDYKKSYKKRFCFLSCWPSLFLPHLAASGESSFPGVSCLWRGPCGRDRGRPSASSQQETEACYPTTYKGLNPTNNSVSDLRRGSIPGRPLRLLRPVEQSISPTQLDMPVSHQGFFILPSITTAFPTPHVSVPMYILGPLYKTLPILLSLPISHCPQPSIYPSSFN